jgi:DNA-directed RNA polymerase subunit RPC12/RpoP
MRTEQAHGPGNLRCGKCNKLLAKGHIEAGEIELFCPRCKSRIVLRAISPNLALPQSGNDGLHNGERYVRETPSVRS